MDIISCPRSVSRSRMRTRRQERKQPTPPSQNGNGHGGRRQNSGRMSNRAKAIQFAKNDKSQPTIERLMGQEYHKQARSGEAKRLTKKEALLKRDFEIGEEERAKSRRAKQEDDAKEANQAAQKLIDLYKYCRTTQ